MSIQDFHSDKQLKPNDKNNHHHNNNNKKKTFLMRVKAIRVNKPKPNKRTKNSQTNRKLRQLLINTWYLKLIFNKPNIILCIDRKLLKCPCIRYVCVPSWESLILNFHFI